MQKKHYLYMIYERPKWTCHTFLEEFSVGFPTILRHLYIIYERPKWTCHTFFLEKWLNRFGNFWYHIESTRVSRVNYGLDFAFSPRGPCPSSFMHVQKSATIWRQKKGLSAVHSSSFLPPNYTGATPHKNPVRITG